MKDVQHSRSPEDERAVDCAEAGHVGFGAQTWILLLRFSFHIFAEISLIRLCGVYVGLREIHPTLPTNIVFEPNVHPNRSSCAVTSMTNESSCLSTAI